MTALSIICLIAVPVFLVLAGQLVKRSIARSESAEIVAAAALDKTAVADRRAA